MSKLQQQVLEFHKVFEIEINEKPCIPSNTELRVKLIQEELTELVEAFEEKNVVKTADAIGDLLYVVYGAAVACGIDMDPITDEIHRSNMTKVGGYKNEYGKLVKPATYQPPLLDLLVYEQSTR